MMTFRNPRLEREAAIEAELARLAAEAETARQAYEKHNAEGRGGGKKQISDQELLAIMHPSPRA